MSLRCAIGGHAAGPEPVYNSGYYFSPCRHCGRYLLRSAGGEWGTVPIGHRIVWKAGRHSHSLEADYTGVLPVACGQTNLPVRPRRRSNRALVPLRSAPAGGGAAAVEQEESGDYPHPRLLLAAVVVGAGLKMIFGSAFGR